jgi:hypothetical protein
MWKPQADQNTGEVTAVELAATRKIMGHVAEIAFFAEVCCCA